MKKSAKTMLLTAALCLLSTGAYATHSVMHYSGQSLTEGSSRGGVVYEQTQTLGTGDIVSMQRKLASLDFYHGPIDGVWGPRTTAAIQAYQMNRDFEPTGTLTADELRDLNVFINEPRSATRAALMNDITPAAGDLTGSSVSYGPYTAKNSNVRFE